MAHQVALSWGGFSSGSHPGSHSQAPHHHLGPGRRSQDTSTSHPGDPLAPCTQSHPPHPLPFTTTSPRVTGRDGLSRKMGDFLPCCFRFRGAPRESSPTLEGALWGDLRPRSVWLPPPGLPHTGSPTWRCFGSGGCCSESPGTQHSVTRSHMFTGTPGLSQGRIQASMCLALLPREWRGLTGVSGTKAWPASLLGSLSLWLLGLQPLAGRPHHPPLGPACTGPEGASSLAVTRSVWGRVPRSCTSPRMPRPPTH